MDRRAADRSGHAELLRVVRGVRRRWRLRVALRGVLLVVAVALVSVLAAVAVLQWLSFAPAALVAARAVAAVAVLAAAVRYLVLPLLQPVSDQRVALYLEEREPSLQEALVSALEQPGGALSPVLARRTIETAIERCRAVELGRHLERARVRRYGGMLAGLAVAGAAVFLLSPVWVRHGATVLLLPHGSAEAARPYRVEVSPGDATVPRGADQAVSASLLGFQGRTVEVVTRTPTDSVWERAPMLLAPDSAGYEVLLFDLREPTQYYVEADGVRSPVYRISVADVPYVERLQLELQFPAYTGLPPRLVEGAGDIAALPGTTVRVRATPTLPVAAARLLLDDDRAVPLSPDSAGALAGEFQVRQTGFYHVELQTARGSAVEGTPRYLIDVLDDAPPAVSFSTPGRDVQVTSVDEIFLEARAHDDYGVSRLELVYSVNGQPERTTDLYRARPLPEVTAGHTLYLEELDLQPGDLVSYYARARDAAPGGAERQATSDIYFLEVRPFGREYRQSEQPGGGPQAGAGGVEATAGQLSQQQRDLIAGTFNVQRARASTPDQAHRDNVATLAQAQQRLREQVQTLIRRMGNRDATDSTFQRILETLPRAAAEMETAVQQLQAGEPGEALPPEQRALLHLQRVEALYRDVNVSTGAPGGGGGGGGAPAAEDLADLFGLELDKLRNQYETVQRDRRQQAQQETDETLERVRELARRQEQQNQRLQDLAQRLQRAGGGGAAGSGEAQRQMAEQAEEEARRLERLSREQQRSDLAEAARRLREAADAMRRAAASSGQGGAADGSEALERLRDVRRRLEQGQQEQLQRELASARQQADRLTQEQRRIAEQMQDLAGGDAGAEGRAERARRLLQSKAEQAGALRELEGGLDRLAAQSRSEQPDAAREIRAAAESIRANRLEEMIHRSGAGTQPGAPEEYVRRFEQHIAEGLEGVRQRLARAQQSVQPDDSGRSQEAADRARDLARGLQSLQQRTRTAMERPSPDEQAANEGEGGQQSPQGQNQPGQGGAEQEQQGERGQDETTPGASSQGENRQGQDSGDARGQGGTAQGEGTADPQGARADRPSAPAVGGVAGSGVAGGAPNLAPHELRQLRGEARARLQQARELRDHLQQEGLGTEEVDQLMEQLRALDSNRSYADWEELQFLQASLVDRAQQLEFSLRRSLESEQQQRLFLSGAEGVPDEFRTLVERYYRELAGGSR